MAIGAGLGLGLYGFFGLFALIASGEASLGGLAVRLILLAAFVWVWRSYSGYREELADTNRSGRMLAWLTVFITVVAAFFSAALLL